MQPPAEGAQDLCDQHPLRADVTGGGRQDRIVHAWNDGAPQLLVCTADGLRDQLAGMGQTELLATIDVEPDGRHEIVYGTTTASLAVANIAVWVDGRLHRVTGSSGEALELRQGSERQGETWKNGDQLHDWGCEDFTGDGVPAPENEPLTALQAPSC